MAVKRVAASWPLSSPGEGWTLIADYDRKSANYMRWFWERGVVWEQGVLG